MASDEEKLKKAKVLRSVEINRIGEILKVAQDSLSDANLHYGFQSRYEHVDTIKSTFYKQHNTILGLIPDTNTEFATQDAIRKSFDYNYYEILSIYHQVFDNRNANATPAAPAGPRVQLPKLNLVKFDGDHTVTSKVLILLLKFTML